MPLDLYEFKTVQMLFYIHEMRHVTNHLLSWQVAHLQTWVLWTKLQMRDVLGYRTVLNSQVVLYATVVSPLGLLLSMSATLLIIWRVLVSENAREMETRVVLFHSVLLVSCKDTILCTHSNGYNK